jgi:lambda family phage portal protein
MIFEGIRALFGRAATAAPAPSARPGPSRARAQWGRDTRSGILASRRRPLIDSRDGIRREWDRLASVALDLVQNSGRLKGACDQVCADTIGTGLKLSARPDLGPLRWSPEEISAWVRIVEGAWKRYVENPDEVDFRGKFDLATLVDIGLRHHIAYGETVGTIDFFDPATCRAYGIETGTKFLLMSPHRLVRETDETRGLHSGVFHDANGRPTAYRFSTRRNGVEEKRDRPARDADDRTLVVHAFDPWDGADVRGVSVLASALRTQAMAETLGDATLSTAILQTVLAVTLTSPEPSAEVFDALERLDDIDRELKTDFLGYLGSRLDQARGGGIRLDGDPQVSHLAPGEDLKIHTAETPSSNYLPFAADLRRELARAIGVMTEALTMDYSEATYSSVRMGSSSIWPVVLRRRRRIAAPIYQSIYESWLDEQVATGRIPFRGGYRAFAANRARATWAEWQGPAKPTADDWKSAKSASERMQNGTTSLEYECAEMGLDYREVIEQRARETKLLAEAGLPNPFLRVQGGGGADPAADQTKSSGGGDG